MTKTKKDQTKSKIKDTAEEDGAGEELEVVASNEVENDNGDIGTIREEHLEQAEGSEDDLQENQFATYEELLVEVDDLKDQLLRAVAEAENVRRRTEREKLNSSKYAITNFAQSILTVADNLNRALESVGQEAREMSEEINNLCVGIEMTSRDLDNVYEQFGVKPIEAVGKRFDHNFHQAMYEVDDPQQPTGLVVEQIQKGYTIHGRLLRPSMVAVSKGGPNHEDTTEHEENMPSELPNEKVNKAPSSAYAKQADAANQEAETDGPQVDKEL